jgi:hypothetical protein
VRQAVLRANPRQFRELKVGDHASYRQDRQITPARTAIRRMPRLMQLSGAPVAGAPVTISLLFMGFYFGSENGESLWRYNHWVEAIRHNSSLAVNSKDVLTWFALAS